MNESKGFYQVAVDASNAPTHFKTPKSTTEWIEMNPLIDDAVEVLQGIYNGKYSRSEALELTNRLKELQSILKTVRGEHEQ
jgi:DNA-binding SARP family transcriptional activator